MVRRQHHDTLNPDTDSEPVHRRLLEARTSARLAKRAGVGRLILTHISRRYHGRQVLEEAQAIFPDVVVASDFDQVQVKRAGVMKLR